MSTNNYIIVVRRYTSELEHAINELLAKGYGPLGGAVKYGDGVMQTMWKVEFNPDTDEAGPR